MMTNLGNTLSPRGLLVKAALISALGFGCLALPAAAQAPAAPAAEESTSGAPVQAFDPNAKSETTDAAPAPSINTAEVAKKQEEFNQLSPISMFLGATPIVKAVMILLILASVWTWTIFLDKTLWFSRQRARAKQFLAAFHKETDLDVAFEKLGKDKSNPFAISLAAGVTEWHKTIKSGEMLSPELRDRLQDRVNTAINLARAKQNDEFTKGMSVLATVGSISPFVGLFGTVYGIMNSFIGIANTNTTNLAVVAPGIAEALLATGIGLAAAIPAVIIYNRFAKVIESFNADLENFAGEFSTALSRHLDRRA